MEPVRKIIHIDMDAFFASVEQRDHPGYRGRPLAVGGKGPRSVVAAASYEARTFGVRSAMPMRTALKKCPQLLVVAPRMAIYREVSLEIREIFHQYADLVEPISVDEAFLDVTADKQKIGSATLVARAVKAAIRERTGLTASAGAAHSKFLAKVASDLEKPDGLTVIRPEEAAAFIEGLPVEKIHGVGEVTAAKMTRMGIHTGLDLKQRSLDELTRAFGKAGAFYHKLAHDRDDRPVNPHRERKSIGAESTFNEDITALEDLEAHLERVAAKVGERMTAKGARGRTVTLKVKFADFHQITRARSFSRAIHDVKEIQRLGRELLRENLAGEEPVRLLGLTVSNLVDDDADDARPIQLEFDY